MVAPSSVSPPPKRRFRKPARLSVSPDPTPAPYSQLMSLLVESPDLDAYLDHIVRLTGQVITTAAACGITVHHDGRPFTVSATGTLAGQVDELQYGADEGPCLDALRTGLVVSVENLALEDRWDGYRPHALAHGVLSSLSLPMAVDGQVVAAMNLYATRPAAFDGPHRQQAETFAARCADGLTVILRQASQTKLHQQLTEAMSSRSVIDQAIGILMGQQRCKAADAFDLLRQASQHRNRKLRDIAADIITKVTGEAPQPPTGFAAPQPPRRGDTGRGEH